jgi:two-component system chemotaxis response regulator CheY
MQDESLWSLGERGVDVASSPSTILLVDDDPDIRALTKTFLEHEGYRVFSSGDAERAVQIFSNVPRADKPRIDLLITDLYLPGRSGMDLAVQLKALRSELPVLMISGGAVDGDQRAQLQQEGWRFLGKPFHLTELLSLVHVMLSPCEAGAVRLE